MRQFKNPASYQAQIGLTGSEKKRMIAMVAALLFVTFAIGYAWLRSNKAETPKELPVGSDMTESVALPTLDVDALGREVRDATAEGRVMLEGAALDRMLAHARRLVPAHYRELGAHEMSAEERASILADPGAHRGDAFILRGWLRELESRRRAPTAPEEHYGRIEDESGAITYFVSTERPERMFADVDYVRLDGRLMSVFSEENRDAPGTWIEAPLIVGSTLEQSWKQAKDVSRLDVAFLYQTVEHDGVEVNENGLPTIASYPQPFDALWHTMAWGRDGAGEVDWDEAPELDYEAMRELTDNPEAHVGQSYQFPVCRLQGVRVRRAPENPARLDEYTVGWLGNNTWKNVAHFWSPTPNRELALRDYVRARGTFVRNFAYDSAQHGVRIAPMFVVTEIESFSPEGSLLYKRMAVGIAATSVLLTGLFILLVRRDRKKAEVAEADLIRRRKARRAAGKLPIASSS